MIQRLFNDNDFVQNIMMVFHISQLLLDERLLCLPGDGGQVLDLLGGWRLQHYLSTAGDNDLMLSLLTSNLQTFQL